MVYDQPPPQHLAIIEIGSTGVRFLVAQIAANDWEILDHGGKPVALGRDVFTSGSISRESLLNCLKVLNDLKELLSAWGVTASDTHTIATSALREAENRDIFIDRVYQQTGFRINIVEGIEENRLMYLATRFAIKNDRPVLSRSNALIIEVGGGSTELMLLRRGKMVAAHSLRLGTILIDQQVRQAMDSQHYLQSYLEENIRNTIGSLSAELNISRVRGFIAIGSEMRLTAMRLGTELNQDCWTMERPVFEAFINRIQVYSVEDCVHKLHLPFSEAEGFIPSLLTNKLFLEKTAATEIIVPNVSIREGYLISLSSGIDSVQREEQFSQVIASAISLGRKYRFDESHSLHVAALAKNLFDALQNEHGLDSMARLLLEISAILHDIGMYIHPGDHHKHSQYLIANSEIFGLNHQDLEIVANTVLYHRHKGPSASDIGYITLPKDSRIMVLKLASLLRVADALDRGHSRRVKKLSLERSADNLLIRTGERQDLTMERLALEEKADLFENVFGLRVILV